MNAMTWTVFQLMTDSAALDAEARKMDEIKEIMLQLERKLEDIIARS